MAARNFRKPERIWLCVRGWRSLFSAKYFSKTTEKGFVLTTGTTTAGSARRACSIGGRRCTTRVRYSPSARPIFFLKHPLAGLEQLPTESSGKFDTTKLHAELKRAFAGKALYEVVFTGGKHSPEYKMAKRTLFDTLYLLYILRRRVSVNLQYVIEGLQVLHALEALAIDQVISKIMTNSYSIDPLLRSTLEALFSELKKWNGTDPLMTFPLVGSHEKLLAYLSADPIIHLIFARLHRYKMPFNDIKPIGVGDLMVVKQWLLGYVAGDIAHIDNVLKGEVKDRTHRRLEKTDETTSFASDFKQSSTKDTQTTDRLELKHEIDNMVKNDFTMGANANTNVTYNYASGVVVANVGANFGYSRSGTDQTKTSNNYVKETVSKAIEQVERSASVTLTPSIESAILWRLHCMRHLNDRSDLCPQILRR